MLPPVFDVAGQYDVDAKAHMPTANSHCNADRLAEKVQAMITATEHAPQLPRMSIWTIGLMFISGFMATNAFDLWGQVISPALGFANLSPHGLARSLLGNFGLPNGNFIGYFVHFYLVGLIGYPVGWLYVFKPIWAKIVGDRLGWFLPSAIYGFGLWLFAIGLVTSVAGLPFFLNFTGIAWVALVGHVLYGIVLVAVLQAIERFGPPQT